MAWTGQAVVALSVVGEQQALRRLKVRAAPPRVPEGRHMGPGGVSLLPAEEGGGLPGAHHGHRSALL